MYKIAIIGYGKMGHEVEKILLQNNFDQLTIIDNDQDWIDQWNNFIHCDVAIEFSTPENASQNFHKCFIQKIPLVSGTTGWYHQLDELLEDCKKQNSSFIYGTNFSIGANIFFSISTQLAKIINSQDQYDCSIQETHHITKKDAPSGTAITVAQKIINELNNKNSWVLGNAQNENQIPITSYRIGDAIGEHIVTFSSNEDSLSVIHHANNRSGLAQGAVKAALWLIENPGIYNFSDIFIHLK